MIGLDLIGTLPAPPPTVVLTPEQKKYVTNVALASNLSGLIGGAVGGAYLWKAHRVGGALLGGLFVGPLVGSIIGGFVIGAYAKQQGIEVSR